jgi:hypothetical protein
MKRNGRVAYSTALASGYYSVFFLKIRFLGREIWRANGKWAGLGKWAIGKGMTDGII